MTGPNLDILIVAQYVSLGASALGPVQFIRLIVVIIIPDSTKSPRTLANPQILVVFLASQHPMSTNI
jgi:hypothetical protein